MASWTHTCWVEVRSKDPAEGHRLFEALKRFEVEAHSLPGIRDPASRETFVDRIIESQRKAKVFRLMTISDIAPTRGDPDSGVFDPYKAALLAHQEGDAEESYWLLFLAVHFGRHLHSRWQYAADFYGQLGSGNRWSWREVSGDVEGVREWLEKNGAAFKQAESRSGFGNHRKYESLGGRSSSGTGAVVESYVGWVQAVGSHLALFAEVFDDDPADPNAQFDALYRSMRRNVHRFGRTACFDYLTTISKLGLAPIEPGKAYLAGSTGPIKGARLLLGASRGGAKELELRLIAIEDYLRIGFDPLEDALCNWQKAPFSFTPFRG